MKYLQTRMINACTHVHTHMIHHKPSLPYVIVEVKMPATFGTLLGKLKHFKKVWGAWHRQSLHTYITYAQFAHTKLQLVCSSFTMQYN